MKTYVKVLAIIAIIAISLILVKFVNTIVSLSFFIVAMGLLVYYGFIYTGPVYQMPTFKTYEEFKKSKWFSYIQTVYGSVPNKDEFPLDLNYFSILYQNALDEAQIDVTKYILSSDTCPNKKNQLFTNMSNLDPPYIVYLAKIPPYTPIENNKWIEVTHSGSKLVEQDPDSMVGNWMYITPGSGIFFYTGNTISFIDHPDAVKYFLNEPCMLNGKPDKTECCDQFVRLFTAAKDKGYDSVQFTAHSDQRCGLMSIEIIDVKGNSNFTCGDSDISSSYYARYKTGWNHTRDCHCIQDPNSPYSGFLNCSPLLKNPLDGSNILWENSVFTKNNWPDMQYDVAEKKQIYEMAKKNKYGYGVIDVGAHIGDLALPLAKALTNAGRGDVIVYAIDPTKEKCDFMRKIAKINKISNIVIINTGLSDKTEELGHETLTHNNTGGINWRHKDNINKTTFYTLDYLFESGKIGPIGLYHIDVEGYELEALRGSQLVISKFKPIICVEVFKNSHFDKCELDSPEKHCIDIYNFLNELNPPYKLTGYLPNKDLIFESCQT